MSGERRRGMWANIEQTQTHPSTHRRAQWPQAISDNLCNQSTINQSVSSHEILHHHPVITGVYLAAQTSRFAAPAGLYYLLKGPHESTKHPVQ